MANAVSTEHASNQLANALYHLANAAISDKGIMATLTEHINTLTKQNSAIIKQNGMLINAIAHLTNTYPQAINNTPKNKKSYFDPNGYVGHTDKKSPEITTLKIVLTNFLAIRFSLHTRTNWEGAKPIETVS